MNTPVPPLRLANARRFAVFTTLEVVLGCFTELQFERVYDDATGFKELRVKQRARQNRATVAGIACASAGVGILLSLAIRKIYRR